MWIRNFALLSSQSNLFRTLRQATTSWSFWISPKSWTFVVVTEENVSLVVAHSSQIWIYISASVFLHCMSDLLQICLFKLLNDSHNFNPITNMTLFNLKRLFYIITTIRLVLEFFFLNKCLRFVRLIWLFILYLYLNIVTYV